MSKVIVYERPDGRLSVVVPAPASRQEGESEADWLARIAAKDVPAGLAHEVMDAERLPNRRFRDCWRKAGRAVAVNVSLAKEQVLAEIEREVESRLAAVARGLRRTKQAQIVARLESKRRALEAIPGQAAADLDGIDSEPFLAGYQPVWPE